MLRKIVVTGAFIALSTVGAFAKSAPVQVTLANPVKQHEIVIGNIIWKCDGTACVSRSEVSGFDVVACRALANRVGPVTAVSAPNIKEGDTKIQRCFEAKK